MYTQSKTYLDTLGPLIMTEYGFVGNNKVLVIQSPRG